jgi:hypothetical protein
LILDENKLDENKLDEYKLEETIFVENKFGKEVRPFTIPPLLTFK